jgi:hypothetical protein
LALQVSDVLEAYCPFEKGCRHGAGGKNPPILA